MIFAIFNIIKELAYINMINKLLLTCLQRNKRLIIPDLGAFIRKNVDGVGVVLVFVPFLNKDDGVLLSALESWAGVDTNEAKDILREYVEYIKKSLADRGQYIIEGVGVLKYDANNVVYLSKESDAISDNNKSNTDKTSDNPVIADNKPIYISPSEVIKETQQPVNHITVVEQNVDYGNTSQQTVSPVHNRPVPTTNSNIDNSDNEDINTDAEIGFNNTDRTTNNVGTPRNGSVGVRYFSPDTQQQQQNKDENSYSRTIPPVTTINQSQQRRNTINNIYGDSEREKQSNVSPQHNTQQRPVRVQRTGNIYGSSTVDDARNIGGGINTNQQRSQQTIKQQPNVQQPVRRVASSGPNPMGKKKKKGNDWVFIAAITAIILTLFVFIYGWIWGGNIDDELIILDTDNTPIEMTTPTPADTPNKK